MAKPKSTLSDDNLANDFAAQFGNTVRYNNQFGQWLVWNDKHWELDHKARANWRCSEFLRMRADELATFVTKTALGEIEEEHKRKPTAKEKADAEVKASMLASKLLSCACHRNVMTMAKSHKSLVTDVSSWDSNPWLLNTQNGTVDLKTGAVSKHNPKDFITRITKVGVSFDEPTQWLKFLARIMDNSAERLDYIQKIFGYSLVGTVAEARIWFFYGSGANGKSVLLNAMRKILGNYSSWATSSTFMKSMQQQHPTEMARLCGARLVMCGEVGRNQKWDEERIKQITGGDPITARFMNQNFFEYDPQFAVVLAGNHKPKFEHVDEAVKRRFNFVPFDVTIPEHERDRDLALKLEEEYPQILGWLIKGCLKWQEEGLAPPALVEEVTNDYLTQGDTMLAWFTECCAKTAGVFTPSTALYVSFNKWCQDNGEKTMSIRGFSMQLEDRARALGLKKIKTQKARGFEGVEIIELDDID